MRPQDDPSTCREFVWDEAAERWSRCASPPVGEVRHPDTGEPLKVCREHGEQWQTRSMSGWTKEDKS